MSKSFYADHETKILVQGWMHFSRVMAILILIKFTLLNKYLYEWHKIKQDIIHGISKHLMVLHDLFEGSFSIYLGVIFLWD